MEFSTIELSVQERVARLWLNRPAKRNALNADMLNELTACFQSLSRLGEAQILVIQGHGKVFCAGADLAFMSDTSQKTDTDLKAEATLFFDCFESLYRLPVPVLCYVHGAVHGGANGLLAASDFVFADQDTKFSFSEVRMGLVPATIAPFVIRRMGIIRARQYMLSGQLFDAREACEAGLVDHRLKPETGKAEMEEMIGLLRQNAPGAVGMTKKLLHDIEGQAITRELRAMTAEVIAGARRTDEAREGIDAFFSKRQPNWRNLE
jgi:methylglutaconyl-CoA hydratase